MVFGSLNSKFRVDDRAGRCWWWGAGDTCSALKEHVVLLFQNADTARNDVWNLVGSFSRCCRVVTW